MQGRWGEVPFAALTAALAAGVAAVSLPASYSFAGLAAASGILIGAAILAFVRNRSGMCLSLSLCGFALGGLLLGLAERDGYSQGDVRAMIAGGFLPLGEQVLLDGCVLEDGVLRGADLQTTIDLRGFRRKDTWISCRGTIQLRVTNPAGVDIPGADLKYGDRVRVWAECDVPRNFMNPGSPDRAGLLARHGIFLVARCKSPRLFEVLRQDFGTPWSRAVASVRRSLHERILKLEQEGYPERAAVLSSIVLGDYIDLSAAARTEFQNAGTYHVLVVSGLHVSTIAWVLVRLLRLVRVPLTVSRLLAAFGILFFTYLVGFQASMTRALWMFILYLTGQSLFRKASPANIVLACAFLLLCAHPGWLRDAGFQLSFLSVTAIVLMGLPAIEGALRPLLDPLRHVGDPGRLFLEPGKWHRLGRCIRFHAEIFAEACADRMRSSLERILLAAFRAVGGFGFSVGSMFLISLSVQAMLEPVLAYYFNRLSWIAPIANLAVVPLSSLVLLVGMAAEILTSLIPWAWPAFRFAGWTSAVLLEVNRWFAARPGAWQRCPTLPGVAVTAGFLLIFFWCFLRRRRLWIPCALIGLEIATLSLTELRVLSLRGMNLPFTGGQTWSDGNACRLRLTFLDVGQGDAMVIQFPDGRVWAIDAGGLRADNSRGAEVNPFDVGEAVVSRFLWTRWIVALDRTVLTHPHQDHAGGMAALLRNFPTGRFDYADAGGDPAQTQILEVARGLRLPVHRTGAGDTYGIGSVKVSVLNPEPVRPARSLNDRSVVMRLEYGRFSALLAGDLEGTGEAGILSGSAELSSQLLKVAHHGSRNATSDRFLERVRPRWALISAGRKNPFQNPSPETLFRLMRHGARLLQTMEQGAVFFDTDGTHYSLSSYKFGVLERGLLSSNSDLAESAKMPPPTSEGKDREK